MSTITDIEEILEILPKKRKVSSADLKEDGIYESSARKKIVSGLEFLALFGMTPPEIDQVQFKEIRRKDLHLDYCEKFLSKPAADALFQFCENSIRYPEQTQIQVYGKWHSIPRKQIAFGDDGMFYGFSGAKVPAEKWPKEVEALNAYVSKVVGTDFNFVLVNRYADGNDHIGEHRDDEKELDPQSCIASLSIGQCRDFVLRHESRVRKIESSPSDKTPMPENMTLQLRHGSLLLMRPPTNKLWYHSLPIRKRAMGVRINFTFRKILRT